MTDISSPVAALAHEPPTAPIPVVDAATIRVLAVDAATDRIPAVDAATVGIPVVEPATVPVPVPAPTQAESGAALRVQVGSALRWSMVNSLMQRVLQIGVGILVARLVAPEQFGVYAVALVVMNIVLSVSEMGVSVALVRTDEPLEKVAPTVTTLSLGSGASLALVCALGAPWFAGAMNAPQATGVIQLMSVALLFAGASAVPGAILQREFRQDLKLASDTTGFVVGTVVVIVLALTGFGAWSLAWSRVATNAVAAIAMIAMTPRRFLPGFDRARARELLAFGLPLAGSSLLVLGVLNVDQLTVGALLGPTQLAFYLIAFNLSSWPVSAFSLPVQTVSLPVFSRLRDDPVRFRDSFARALRMLAALTIPACVLLGALSASLVHVAYGTAWAPAAAALGPLAVVGGLRVALELSYDFLAGAGRARVIFWIHLLWLAALAPLLVLGAHLDGIRGVALGQVAAVVLFVVPAYLVAMRPFGVRVSAVGRALARPALGGLAMIAVVALVIALVPAALPQMLIGGVAAVTVYAVIAAPMRHDILSTLRRRRPLKET